MIFLIALLTIFFAMNMGGASFAASFAASYGSGIVSRKKAGALFMLFVVLGAVLFGENVSTTLGSQIMPVEIVTPQAILIIFFTASFSMFFANLIHIPQSTSLVTVGAIAGVGAFYSQVNLETIYFLLPFWIFLPILSFALTYYISKFIYPPRKSNFWIYEKFVNSKERLRKFVVISNCYNAFSVGTNNVANVVGPLVGAGVIGILPGLAGLAVVFGLGAFLFSGPIKTAGEKIVPLGPVTASIVALVCGSFMIIASWLGIPQSFVMLKLSALFAISTLKNGKEFTFQDKTTQKTFYTWVVNPVLTFFASYLLAAVFLER